jgi:AraC-like DNA-binding protein
MALMRHPPIPADCAPRGWLGCAARDLILADPARPWRIRSLARPVGLNEKKLKSGFRSQSPLQNEIGTPGMGGFC